MSMSINSAALLTTGSLSVATIACVIGAATSVSTVALIAYTALGITLGAASIAAITAYIDSDTKDVGSYFANVGKHSAVVVVGMYTLVAQKLLGGLVDAIVNGLITRVTRKVSGGADITFRQV
jgi:hypothetical protein